MNKIARGILIGMVLGDGCLNVSGTTKNGLPSVTLRIKHSVKQIEYAEHKADLLQSTLGRKRPEVHHFENNGYPGVRLSKTDPYLRILRMRMYQNGKKHITRKLLDMLTDQGLAIWWMDDGTMSMKRREGKICARQGFLHTYLSLEENQVIVDWLWDQYGVHTAPVKDGESYRLRFNTTNLKLFVPIIKPYIIPSMQYKIDMRYPEEA